LKNKKKTFITFLNSTHQMHHFGMRFSLAGAKGLKYQRGIEFTKFEKKHQI